MRQPVVRPTIHRQAFPFKPRPGLRDQPSSKPRKVPDPSAASANSAKSRGRSSRLGSFAYHLTRHSLHSHFVPPGPFFLILLCGPWRLPRHWPPMPDTGAASTGCPVPSHAGQSTHARSRPTRRPVAPLQRPQVSELYSAARHLLWQASHSNVPYGLRGQYFAPHSGHVSASRPASAGMLETYAVIGRSRCKRPETEVQGHAVAVGIAAGVRRSG